MFVKFISYPNRKIDSISKETYWPVGTLGTVGQLPFTQLYWALTCALYAEQCTVNSVQCTVYSAQCSVNSVQ